MAAEQAPHYLALEDVQRQVRELRLPQLDEGQVYVRWVFTDRNVTLPSVQVVPFGTEIISGATNLSEDIGYPIAVGIVAAQNQDLEANLELFLGWRWRLIRKFRTARFKRFERSMGVEIEAMSVVDPAVWSEANLFVSAIVLRVTNRETRG